MKGENEVTPTTQQRMQDAGIVPVLRAQSQEEALALVRAMHAGGITVMEVTTTVPNAPAVLRQLRAEYGDALLLGSGTVTDVEQCEETIAAGAEFVVSPSLHPDVIARTRALGKLMVAGALTPTEVVTAWRAGAHVIKIFPCSAMGGAPYLRALQAPFPGIPLLPTGGITLATARDFLDAGAIALGVGSDLVSASAIRAGHAHQVTETARAYCALVKVWRGEWRGGTSKTGHE